MNTLEYSNIHLRLHGILHMTQVVQPLVLNHLSSRHYLPVHVWEPNTVQVVVHI
jgi:hypothetical protein